MNKKILAFIYLQALALFVASTTISFAASSGGISVTPYYAPNEQARGWFIYKDVKPNAIINDKVSIHNLTKESLDLLIYAVDAETARDGGYAPKSDDEAKIGVGKWTTLVASEIIVKPNEQKIIPFTIRVPEKVGIGDHGGTILVKRKVPEKKISVDKDGKTSEASVGVVTRIGTRIYVTVAGPLIKKLAFDALAFHKDEAGKPFFYFSLANEGNTHLTLRGKLEIYDTEKKLLDSFDVNLREIFPFTETVVPVAWEKQRDGKFIAQGIIQDPDGEGRLIATTRFDWTIPKIPTPVEINSTFQQLLVGAGIVIFALFAIVAMLMLMLRKKK